MGTGTTATTASDEPPKPQPQRRILDEPFEPTIMSPSSAPNTTGAKASLSPQSPTFRTGRTTTSSAEDDDDDIDEDKLNTTVHLSPEPTSEMFAHRATKDGSAESESCLVGTGGNENSVNSHVLGFDRLGEGHGGRGGGRGHEKEEELESFANSPAADPGDEENEEAEDV